MNTTEECTCVQSLSPFERVIYSSLAAYVVVVITLLLGFLTCYVLPSWCDDYKNSKTLRAAKVKYLNAKHKRLQQEEIDIE
jgi:hypothetical protein